MKNNKFKKLIPVVALAALSLSLHAENGRPGAGGGGISTSSLRVSNYMMAPTSAWVGGIDGVKSNSANVTVTKEFPTVSQKLGFRVIHLRASTHAQKSGAVDLAASGLVQPGDIFLSFRPEWNGTLAYAHMQLGISHTGVAFVVDDGGAKFVHTVESPISYSSPMNYQEHYGDLNAIHVIRPTLTDAQKLNLGKWAKLALSHKEKLGFYKDYGAPFYKRGVPGVTTPRDQIQHLAKILTDKIGGSFDSYCSEWAFTLLGLRNCAPAEYNDGNPACSEPIFGTKSGALTGLVPRLAGPNSGLIQGPEAALVNGGLDAQRTEILTKKTFVDVLSSPDELAGRMSSGHRAVAEANSGLMKTINTQYYAAGETQGVADAINAKVVENFSPTSFMIRSNTGVDGLQYVGTVVWDR